MLGELLDITRICRATETLVGGSTQALSLQRESGRQVPQTEFPGIQSR